MKKTGKHFNKKKITMGPSYCEICNEWPARQTERGNRCHLCENREWCDEHPVPLPDDPETVKKLADLGYEPAIRELNDLKDKL